ncbi:MAG: FapA family protein [Defluviitaleaceae bacterium]|nr:FapA family protein [Defluviitaleaceae bacterium]
MINTTKPINETMTIEISPDKMIANVTFKEAMNGGDGLTKEDIIEQLERQNIKRGIIKGTLRDIIYNRMYNKKYLIAQGLKAETGESGKVEPTFDISGGSFKPVVKEDGSVDYKNLDNIIMTEKDDVVANIFEPTMGKSGYTVLGDVLKGKEGKKIASPKGKGTYISEDGTKLLAEKSGKVSYQNGKISVLDVYEIKGDVNAGTGNINFNGSVIVRGNVTSGFSVNATGNIEIFGNVEAASLTAGGSIFIKTGINGSNDDSHNIIKSMGNLTSKIIQNANLDIKGDLFSESILHSTINCGGTLEINGSKGILIGGRAVTLKGVKAKTLGTHMGTKTEIVIGEDVDYQDIYNKKLEKYNKISHQYRENIKYINGMIERQKSEEGSLNETLQSSLLNTVNKTNELKSEKEILEVELEQLKETIEQNKGTGTIKVSGSVFPGVILRIGNAKEEILIEDKNLTFRNVYDKKTNREKIEKRRGV